MILETIGHDAQVSAEQLAEQLGVSVKTIKRDLKAMSIRWEGHSKTGKWCVPKGK